MKIILGNIDGKSLGLNASEACVYAAIEKCSRGDNAKGWYGTMEALAAVLPFKIGRVTVSRAIAKLLTLGVIKQEGEKLFTNVQNEQNNVQNEHENVQNEHENVQNELPPNTPPINNKKNMNEEKEQPRADMRSRDGANEQQSSELLTAQFYAVRNAWISIGGSTREFEQRAMACWTEWRMSSKPKRQAIYDELSLAAMAKKKPEHWKDNPLFFLRDFPEPVPTNYNGARSLPDEPLVIATYREIGGIYTEREAKLFGMNIIKPFKP